MAGLLPILWSSGSGSEMVSSTLLTLIVIPAIYGLVKGFGFSRRAAGHVPEPAAPPSSGSVTSQPLAPSADP
jgi:Cu(I)/Ag(I) efflux system membrane protein CusA/SilA